MMEIENIKQQGRMSKWWKCKTQQGRALNNKNTKSQKWRMPNKDKKH
jgi:hypothetical protein